MKTYGLFLLSLVIASCGDKQTGDQYSLQPNANFLPTGTVSFVKSTPEDKATEVSVDQTLQLQYSGPLRPQSVVDGRTIKVVDDMKNLVPGTISVNNNNIVWTPTISSRRVSFNGSTHYRIFLDGVEDASGLIIAPWNFDFYTRQIKPTGKFYITYFGKQRKADFSKIDSYDTALLPWQGVEVEFSEPVSPNGATCSDTTWSDVFQIVNADLGNAVGVKGQVCLLCRANGNCNVLRFMPKEKWINGSALAIQIRPSLTLKGVVSQEPLRQEDSQTKTFVVIPDLSTLFK